ncbi:MAG: hypothetical protein WCA35_23190 [Kovacikia sp.]
MQGRGFSITRYGKEKRGGAGKGQGRHPRPDPVYPVKLRLDGVAYQAMKKYLAVLKRRSGMYVSILDWASDLILNANWNLVAPNVKRLPDTDKQLIISRAADERLADMVREIRAARPGVTGISKASVFSAIILMKIKIDSA